MSEQNFEMGGLKVVDGKPLRGDGTPFPDDESLWSPEEKAYLAEHYFQVGELGDGQTGPQVALVEPNEIDEEVA